MVKNQKKLNYGNWIPIKIILIPFILSVILSAILLLINSFYIKVIISAVIVILFIFFLYNLCAFWLLGKKSGKIQRQFYNALLDKLNWDGKGKAIDIVTGNGFLAVLIARNYSQAKVVGIDQWSKLWDYSKSICENNAEIEGVINKVTFKQANAVNLPFADNEFDAVTSNFVFHAIKVEDRKQLVKEALRILKFNGVFAFQDLFNKEFYGNIDLFISEIKKWNLKKVEFIKTSTIFNVPVLLRINHVTGNSGILFGIK